MQGVLENMLDSVQLKNYRCFENSNVKFKDITLIVGKNNAGKSSLLEAMRLITLAIRKATKTTYKELPVDLGAPLREKGFRLEAENLKIDLRGIVYLYENKVAKIISKFDNGCKIIIYANSAYVYAVIYDEENRNVKTKSSAQKLNIGKIGILPQIGLIKETEKILSRETVEGCKETYLSSRHFRNEVLLYKDEFWKKFVKLAEETWEGLKIEEISTSYDNDNVINLYVKDNNFLAEIGLMGSGLQMWLQIMWFLCRSENYDTVILDEPDVYMHPDLQRKLIRLVRDRYPQTIIATHSVEIITELEANNILTIDKKKRSMSYATDLKGVQKIVDDIGAINNLSLSRIGNYRKCIFVEGDDLKILAKIADKINADKSKSLLDLPHVPLGGFNNLKEAFGTSKLFYEETNGIIQCYCILDRDYFPEEQIKKKYEQAYMNSLYLHIWERKELENYLLEPHILYKVVGGKDNYEDFIVKLEKLVDDSRIDVIDQYSQHFFEYEKSIGPGSSNKKARNYVYERWTTLESKLSLVGGKEFIKKFNSWIREEYGINSCSINKLISLSSKSDYCEEIIDVIETLTGAVNKE